MIILNDDAVQLNAIADVLYAVACLLGCPVALLSTIGYLPSAIAVNFFINYKN
ncbi:hypothetical protein [Ferruginibacter albus]|uniref:hypothetical protein n=1 Tax=Ferruginibacter albus TaxID=2875540 RepID=UPI001CC73962|nr:hypothetical protein [Ferruginibacter albus]UAY52074.1 hypothetical protein K9M53_15975 [Ferruginibacter albus]